MKYYSVNFVDVIYGQLSFCCVKYTGQGKMPFVMTGQPVE